MTVCNADGCQDRAAVLAAETDPETTTGAAVSDETGPGVPGGGGGLREALEALARNWEATVGGTGPFATMPRRITAPPFARELRAVLAAHPTDAPAEEDAEENATRAERAQVRVADLERQNGLLLKQAEEHWGHRQRSEARVAELEAEVERLAESARTAWAVHSEHVEMMNRRLLHVQAVADERLNAAEARARRAEERVDEYAIAAAGTLAEHERLTQALRDIRDRVGTSTEAWHIADRALSAADQTSDATPSDTTAKED